MVLFRVAKQRVSDVDLRLDDEFGILCRVGLDCSPVAHKTPGTFAVGTVRLAPGTFATMDDINAPVVAIERVGSRSCSSPPRDSFRATAEWQFALNGTSKNAFVPCSPSPR